jgi:hypothetical protein
MGTGETRAGPRTETAVDSFFYDQALYGRYRLPTLIAFVTGIVWALQPVAIYYSMDVEARENIKNAIATDWMIHFITPAVFWILFWIAFVILGYYVVGARMRMGRLFKLTGWGIVSFSLMGIGRAAGKYFAYQSQEIPVGVLMGQFPSEWNGYNAMVAVTEGHPMIVGTNIASLVFMLVSAYIWFYAFKYSTDIKDRRDILIVVGIPILLYAAYVIYYSVA